MNILLLGVEDRKGMLKSHSLLNVGLIGYLSDEIKGIDVFADGILKVNESEEESVWFSLVGSGELSDNVRQKLQRTKNVTVKGEVPKEHMDDIYDSLDVVVCASRMDSLSMVIIEALMHEKLVIVSSAAGISEYITNGVNGFVFESENVGALKDDILWVLNNREKAKIIASNGRKLYEERFTIDEFENRVCKVLEEWVV